MSSYNLEAVIRIKDAFSNPLKQFRSSLDSIKSSMNTAKKNTDKFSNSLDKVGKKSSDISGALGKVSGIIAGIGIAKIGKDALMMASDLNEVQNVVDTTFGDSASAINDFAKTTSNQFGISELQAKRYSSTLGAMLKSAGFTGDELKNMSTSLAGLSGDMASFYNLDPDEAFDKLKAGISGETEPLKSLGVDISDTTVATYAMANGFNKQWKNATQAEKELWRYKAIMKQTKDAQGDYSKTSDSFANQLRTMKLNFQSLTAKIMGTSIPAFQTLFNKINNFMANIDINSITAKIQEGIDKITPFASAVFDGIGKIFSYLIENKDTIIPIISGIAGAFVAFNVVNKVVAIFSTLSKVITVIKSVIVAIQAFIGGAGTIGECLAVIASPVGVAVGAIGLLVGFFILAWNTSESFRNKVTAAFNSVKDKVMVVIGVIKGKIDEFKAKLEENKEAVQFIMDILKGIFNGAVAVMGAVFESLAGTIGKVISDIGTIFSGIIDVLGGVIEIIQGVVTGNWDKVWQGIKDTVSGVVEIITGLWNGLVDLLSHPIDTMINITKSVFGGEDDTGTKTETVGENYTGTSNWKGGLTQVNERGYEVMNLPSGTSIMNHQGSEALLDKIANSFNNSGSEIHVHMEGSTFSKEVDVNSFMNTLMARLKTEQLKMA